MGKIKKTITLEETPEIQAFLDQQSNLSGTLSLLIKQAYYQAGGKPVDIYKSYTDSAAQIFFKKVLGDKTTIWNVAEGLKASTPKKNPNSEHPKNDVSFQADVSSLPSKQTAKSSTYIIPEGY